VGRASYEHGVSSTDASLHALGTVPVLLAWLRGWPWAGLWRDLRWASAPAPQQQGPGLVQGSSPGCA